MSSVRAEAGPRERLFDAALRALEHGGPTALQARKLAAEIGASTMAVYTHFGGMSQLFEAIVREGFDRFGAQLAAVPETEDSMVDFFRQGLAYREFALHNSQLYRLMFGLTGTSRLAPYQRDMTVTGTPGALPESQAAFDHLVRAVEQIKAAGRIRPEDTIAVAGQIWSQIHGFVLLEMTGVFGHEGHGLMRVLGPLTTNLLAGYPFGLLAAIPQPLRAAKPNRPARMARVASP